MTLQHCKNLPPSVAFVIPKLTLRCGVGDYCVRMTALLGQIGVKAALLANEGYDLGKTIKTPEGEVITGELTADRAAEFTTLSVQYVPSFSKADRKFYKDIAKLKHPGIHIMIHECWRIGLNDYRLNPKSRLVAIMQKLLLKSLVRRWQPVSLETSNEYYRSILSASGFAANLSPMPGNIATYEENAMSRRSIEIPKWWNDSAERISIMSFGSLYTNYWDPTEMFRNAKDLEDNTSTRIGWIIAGRISKVDRQKFTSAAQDYGFTDAVWFTGPLEPQQIDWWMNRVTAFFAGTAGEIWTKSGGILAAVERELPVLLPRGWKSPTIEPGGVFVDSLVKLVDFLHHRSENRRVNIATGDRNPTKIAERFAKTLERRRGMTYYDGSTKI